jgi:transposase
MAVGGGILLTIIPAGPPRNGRTKEMKDRSDRAARLQLIGRMFAGQSWQTAVAQSQLPISRSTAYRLVKLARDEDKAPLAFLDDRHGHPYKMTEKVREWMTEFCTTNPQVPSSRVQRELKSRFGIEVSVSQINRVRAQSGVSNQWQGRAQIPVKKTEPPAGCLARGDWQLALARSCPTDRIA